MLIMASQTIWLTFFILLGAGCLTLDGIVGSIGWRGLRVTRLAPTLAFGLAAAGFAIVAFLVERAPFPVAASIAWALILPPLYLGLSILAGRALTPKPWTVPGAFERHRVAAVEIPASEGVIPALLYEPHGFAAGAVLVIHGAGAHKTFYTWPMAEALLHAGFTVCAIDLDGHGDSRRVLDFPSVLDDVQAPLRWLRARWSFVGVVGVSLGGCVSSRAVAEGAMVDALALLEAPITVDITPRVRRREYRTLLRWSAWSLHRYSGTLPLLRAWKTPPTYSRLSTVDLIERLDICGSLAHIHVPLWLCYGTADYVVPLWQVREIKAAAPSGTPLVMLRRATHLTVSLDPRGLQELGAWLAGVVGKKARLDNAGPNESAQVAAS